MTRQALSATVDDVSTNLYAYDVFGNLTNEVQNGAVIARDYDAFGRPTGYALGSGGAGGSPAETDANVAYSYDALGRFASITFGTNVFEYSRLPGTDLVSGYTCGPFSRSVSYEPHRDLISAVTNAFNASTPSTISTFDYANDAAGRRVSRLDTFDGAVTTNIFGYNLRSEVTSALMGTNTYGYAYDPIGNRIESYHNAETNSYTANNLNQYTSIDTAEPTYDADGNMTSDGRGWHYAWNGENRMVCASNADVVVTYAYDHRGRMVRKDIKHRDTEAQRVEYTWDNWNIIQETTADLSTLQPFNLSTSSYVWGLDIDGTLQGAGGVGGLLAVIHDDGVFFPTYDANGNITEYVDASNGAIDAHYDYSPFGELIKVVGPLDDRFTHKFSTKPWCIATRFDEYPYRKYRPDIGRWLSFDAIGEEGGANLYAYVFNSPIMGLDALGFSDMKIVVGANMNSEYARFKVSGSPWAIIDRSLLDRNTSNALSAYGKETGIDCQLDIEYALSSDKDPMTLGRVRTELNVPDGSGPEIIAMIFHGWDIKKETIDPKTGLRQIVSEGTGLVLVDEVKKDGNYLAIGRPYSLDEIFDDKTIIADAIDEVYISCCYSRKLKSPKNPEGPKYLFLSPPSSSRVTVGEALVGIQNLVKELCCRKQSGATNCGIQSGK